MHMPQGYAEPPTSHHGVPLAIFIVTLALILGGLYLWGSELREREAVEQAPDTALLQDTKDELSTSDDITTIEADLAATALESMRTELDILDAEAHAE